MCKSIRDIVKIKLVGTRTDISLLIPISSKDAVNAGHEHVPTDIKLPHLVKERPVHVLLYDVCDTIAIVVLLLGKDYLTDLRQFFANLNPVPTVGIFAWFNYPNIPSFFNF